MGKVKSYKDFEAWNFELEFITPGENIKTEY